ncbi:unnamed protein product [Bursaphelenchus okinawaensis]|uniref:ANF_receptor domain-containing protein n=1 Tax=Bursaphelenchus okinawaensis TaxID=465554 RepID=A0A811JQY0_9BILA|nr:unnamed protein product [Bursaphelenchus okinawaensis]CAG9078638.1 unnamed protein product [Bursaphelenchus okinawaensis]
MWPNRPAFCFPAVLLIINALPNYRPLTSLTQEQCHQYIEKPHKYRAHRITYRDPHTLDGLAITCAAIKSRHFFSHRTLYPKEILFPLAYVRLVYKDYLFLESELAVSYSPQNIYCYAIDAKAPKVFHARLHALSACLPNVIVTRVEYRMDSEGHNGTRSMMECLRMITKHNWKYVFVLQNHDIQIKTNSELIRILQLYNGTNDVQAYRQSIKRIQPGVNWSFKAMNLFKNGTYYHA